MTSLPTVEGGKIQGADEKKAALTLRIKADSGYSSTETHRISANQWSEILMVCADAEKRAKMSAADELLEALQAFANLRDQFPQSIKCIDPKLDAMAPITITVTKGQMLAAANAINKALGGQK